MFVSLLWLIISVICFCFKFYMCIQCIFQIISTPAHGIETQILHKMVNRVVLLREIGGFGCQGGQGCLKYWGGCDKDN